MIWRAYLCLLQLEPFRFVMEIGFYCWLYCSIAARLNSEKSHLRAKTVNAAYYCHFKPIITISLMIARVFSWSILVASSSFFPVWRFCSHQFPLRSYMNAGQRKQQIRSCTGSTDKSITCAAINYRTGLTSQPTDDEFPIGCLIRSRRAQRRKNWWKQLHAFNRNFCRFFCSLFEVFASSCLVRDSEMWESFDAVWQTVVIFGFDVLSRIKMKWQWENRFEM